MAARPGDRDPQPPMAGAAQYAGVGIQFAASIVIFLLAGRWLDGRLGTDPWLMILGVFTGASAGFYSMYRQLVLQPRERERGAQEKD
jgi:ATP synthase protein I